MEHVIKRGDNEYLSGGNETWTNDFRHAKIFPNYESAKKECCSENERPIPLDVELRYYRYRF